MSASLKCDSENTLVTTRTVQARGDGVRVSVNNVSGRPLVLNYTIDRGSGGGGDMIVPAGVSMQVVPFAARTVGFRCLREEDDDEIMDFALDFESVRIVDPDGEAKRAQPLECGSSRADDNDLPTQGDGSVSGDNPVEVVRSYLRGHGLLRSGDLVEAAVGPGPEFPVVRFVRDGRVVGAFWFAQMSPESQDFSLDAVQLCPEVS